MFLFCEQRFYPVHALTFLVLSSIAFQYYPLDLNIESNPFIVSWWPLALADQALFHVSLQTASLYEELQAQKGFPISDLLMVDSIALVRRRIEDSSLAFQDETIDSVVTLAAIEVSAASPLVEKLSVLTQEMNSMARETSKPVKRISMGSKEWLLFEVE